jgi:hypothetical protein
MSNLLRFAAPVRMAASMVLRAARPPHPRRAPFRRAGFSRGENCVGAAPMRRHHCRLETRDDAMSYVDKVLEPGETVVHVARIHWRVYLTAILLLLLAIAALVASLYVPADLVPMPLIAAAVLGLLAVASWLPAFLGRWTTELAVTNRRIIFKSGLFRRHTM